MIKTVSITNTETAIAITGGTHVIITNKGDSVVYVSKYPNVVADGDEVKAIEGNSADILRDVSTHDIRNNVSDWYGTIYLLANSDTKVQLETTNNANFKQVRKGGGAMPNFVKNQSVIGIIENNANTYYFGTYEEV